MAGDAVSWTTDQLRAIRTSGHGLLVSAAAGSGKTAVLAERCAYFVCDAPASQRCLVDELLVVTFTRAAADEMRSRIKTALEQRLAGSDDPALYRQLMLLQRAQINTVHGFCTSVLRRHFNLAGLDPNFRMLEDEEARLLRLEVAREMLARRHETDTDGALAHFVDVYADGVDESVIRRVLRLHELLSSVVDPDAWIDRAIRRLDEINHRPFAQTETGRALASLINEHLADLRDRCVAAATIISRFDDLEDYLEHVNGLLAIVIAWQDRFGAGDFDALAREVGATDIPKAPSVSGDVPDKDAAKKVIDALKKHLKEGAVRNLAQFTTAEWADGMKQIVAPARLLCSLVREFDEAYRAAKRRSSSLDFSDLERMTFDVLHTRGSDGQIAPSPAALSYQTQFQHVLVDEYQDINELQDAILALVSRESAQTAPPNLFCVGDVKQSIYRFRLADPRRFMQRDRRFRAGPQSAGQVIDLRANFRSRGPLLGAINECFVRLMTESAAELTYDESHHLVEGLKFPPVPKPGMCFTGAPVELHILPPPPGAPGAAEPSDDDPTDDRALELDLVQREAAFIAGKIRTILGLDGSAPMLVYDKQLPGQNKLRPARFRDIVILMRAMKVKAERVAAMLRAAGVPVHTEAGTGFFDSLEVRDLLSLLHLLDNAQQDVPMAAVLRSPLARLAVPEDGLARVRLAYPKIPFHLAVTRYAREQHDELAAHLNDVLVDISRWRELAHRRPLAEVLWQIYDESGYLAFCGALPAGEQRVANLIELHERARQFGSFQRQGLGRFMQFLRSLQDEEQDFGQPSIASEAEDVVRVMTIHHSKGLEFPIVIIPDLAKKHNLSDAAGAIVADRDAGLALVCVDEEREVRYPSAASVIVSERIRRQSLAEEMRVLYVAMTRAREHLILVGTCKPALPEQWKRRWTEHDGPLPTGELIGGRCMLDWIGPVAIASSRGKSRPIELIMHEESELKELTAPATQRVEFDQRQLRLARLEPLDPPPPRVPQIDDLTRRLTARYPHEWYVIRPAAMSVGALTKEGRVAPAGWGDIQGSDVHFAAELHLPRCVQSERKIAPTEIGSATHLVLQHLDVSRPCDRPDVERQVQRLVERSLLDKSMQQAVDLDAIAWMMNQTPAGELLRRHANTLLRELAVYYPMPQPPPDVRDADVDPLDRVMIRGRLDAVLEAGDGLVVIDYKTDRVTRQTIDARADFYRQQMESYSEAIRAITGRAVTGVYLVFLAARQVKALNAPSEQPRPSASAHSPALPGRA